MKRKIAVILLAAMLLVALPSFADEHLASSQRTDLLDLTGYTSATDSAREGWAFDPVGNNGDPLLTLNSYGSESAHSAPIVCPADITIEVIGDCYIDNAIIGEQYNLISSQSGGYMNVIGSGTLNLYADQYHGMGLCIIQTNNQAEKNILTVEDATVNYYGMERTIHTAYYLQPAIRAFEGITLRNMTLNTFEGGYGVYLYGHTLVGEALTEETASTLEIDGCNINITSITGNNWNYAKGIYTGYGNIHVKNSNVNIEAGSGSFYAYKTITFDEGSNINVMSTPVSTADYAKILYCNRLAIKNGIERVHIGCKRYIAGDVIFTQEDYVSELGDELTVTIGSFENGCFAGATDPDYNNWPAFEVVSGAVEPAYYTVNFYDYDGTLLSTQQVEEGAAAVAPDAPEHFGRLFMYWNADYSCITTDLDVTAVYALLGDADCNGVVNFADVSLLYQYVIGAAELSEQGMINADIDINNTINFADISMVYQFVIGAA